MAFGSRSAMALTETARPFLASAAKAMEPLERPSASMCVTTSTLAPRSERSSRWSASSLARVISAPRSLGLGTAVAASFATTPRWYPLDLFAARLGLAELGDHGAVLEVLWEQPYTLV